MLAPREKKDKFPTKAGQNQDKVDFSAAREEFLVNKVTADVSYLDIDYAQNLIKTSVTINNDGIKIHGIHGVKCTNCNITNNVNSVNRINIVTTQNCKYDYVNINVITIQPEPSVLSDENIIHTMSLYRYKIQHYVNTDITQTELSTSHSMISLYIPYHSDITLDAAHGQTPCFTYKTTCPNKLGGRQMS